MKRLEFTLPDFCRVSWASEAAKQRWSPAIEKVKDLWRILEVETVRTGLRKVGLVALEKGRTAFDVFGGLESAALYGLSPRSIYVSDRSSATDGEDLVVYAVGSRRDVDAAFDAFTHHRDAQLGQLLGYPECCVSFFQEVWNEQRYIDTTWPMALRSMPDASSGIREFEAPVMPSTNMLLRWLCVRPVFHLPCSFQCAETQRIAAQIRVVAMGLGRGDAIESLYQMLRWPVQWSALHGIAEIETPVLRISARTDATAHEYKIRLLGATSEIETAPSGTRFPYATPRRGASSVKAIELPTRRADRPPTLAPWFHSDNGFRSSAEMHRALSPIVRAVAARLPRTVLHIACRNGALLRRVVNSLPTVLVYGVDSDPEKVQHARLVVPEQAENFHVGHIGSDVWGGSWPEVDVCVVMLGRLLEVPREKALLALQEIRERASAVLVYAFDDWLYRGSLDEMALSFGLALSRPFGEDASVAQLVY